jgi:hypothetical protein
MYPLEQSFRWRSSHLEGTTAHRVGKPQYVSGKKKCPFWVTILLVFKNGDFHQFFHIISTFHFTFFLMYIFNGHF